MGNEGWRKLNKIITKKDHSIILTSNNKRIIVDTEDLPLLKDYTWHITQGYAASTERNGDTYDYIRMHRFIMDAPDDLLVDHINHNTLDNRRKNLRLATQTQNQMNQNLRPDNTSGVRGVSWNVGISKWTAYIRVNKKKLYLGSFSDIENARKARIKAEKKYFKSYRYMEV